MLLFKNMLYNKAYFVVLQYFYIYFVPFFIYLFYLCTTKWVNDNNNKNPKTKQEMTAIVGVLNKHAVAIAADSAVTLGGGKKILNSANKLFALSKYHPVAIAVYGNAEFMGTPWEVIIKEYRKELKDKSFQTLRQYVDDFQKFLKHKKYFCTDKEADQCLKSSVENLFEEIKCLHEKFPEKAKRLIRYYEQSENNKLLGGFTDRTVADFNTKVGEIIREKSDELVNLGIITNVDDMVKMVTDAYTRNIINSRNTGLVFAGFGEKEIFPSIYNCSVGLIIGGLLAKKVIKAAQITKSNASAICPFAQTDVMRTMLDGISPKVQDIYIKSLEQTFDKIKEVLADIVQEKDTVLADKVKKLGIEPFAQDFMKLSTFAQRKEYTYPFVQSVSCLEKDDLADFAESLIKLTSLKRKVSFEQETVGGPIDVAVISKGDGLIWMKRKQYFDAKMNQHYFENYFNH